MSYPTMPQGHGPDDPSTGADNDLGLAFSQSNHPSDGPGVNYSRPSQYDGPDVPLQPANVNPSAEGANTETGGGVNPRGAYNNPGDMGPDDNSRGNAPYPDTTVGNR